MKIAVIIPAKDEEKKIVEVVSGIKNLPEQSYEVVVIDDGSKDQTGQLALAAGATVLRHAVNRGQGASVVTGIDYVIKNGFDAAVFFDADGQMSVNEIKKVLAPVISGEYEVSLGSRNLGRAIDMPLIARLVKKLALIFTLITTGLKLTDTHNGFQAWSKKALQKLELRQDRYAYASEILDQIADHNLKYCEVPVTIYYTDYSKKKGQSLFNAVNIIFDLLIKK